MKYKYFVFYEPGYFGLNNVTEFEEENEVIDFVKDRGGFYTIVYGQELRLKTNKEYKLIEKEIKKDS